MRLEKANAAAIKRAVDRLPQILDRCTKAAAEGELPPGVQPQLLQQVVRLIEVVPGVKDLLGPRADGEIHITREMRLEALRVASEEVAREMALDPNAGTVKPTQHDWPIECPACGRETAENIRLRSAIHRLTGKPPQDVLAELLGKAPGAAPAAIEHGRGAEPAEDSAPLSAPAEARKILAAGGTIPESLLLQLTERECRDLENSFGRKVGFSLGDPSAPWASQRRDMQ